MWPETTETAPNSPIARALASSTPVSSAHFTFGNVTVQEHPETAGAERQRGFFLGGPLRLHERYQFARNKREGHEQGRKHDAGDGEDDLYVVRSEPTSKPALRSEQQHEDQARDDRRNGERQVDQRHQQVLAAKVKFATHQAAASPKAALIGTTMTATMNVNKIAARRPVHERSSM